MQIEFVSENARDEWNAFVAGQACFGLLQSWEWGDFKEKMGWKAVRLAMKDRGRILAVAQMLIKPLLRSLASVAYVPRGPIGEWLDHNAMSQLLPEIHRIAQNHRAVFLRVEPALPNDPAIDDALKQHGFCAVPICNQPRATIIVDLTPPLDEILNQMPKNTRRKIRDAARKGIHIELGDQDDLADFYKLMRMTGQRKAFPVRRLAYYENEWQVFAPREKAVLLLAFCQGRMVAANMSFCFGQHAAFFHQASSGESARLNPNVLLVWEGIKWAKSQGCCTYDLWGIPDEVGQAAFLGQDLPDQDPSVGLHGVYRFKKQFSKVIVFYAGAHDYVYRPFLYSSLMNALRHAHGLGRTCSWIDGLQAPRKTSGLLSRQDG